MVKIRLTRHGRSKTPFYRIVACDSRCKRDGRFLELLGTYSPFSKECKINEDALKRRQSQGAQLSETVLRILKKNNIEF